MKRFIILSLAFILCVISPALASHIHSSKAERALEQLIGSGGTIVVDVTEGGTGLSSTTANQILYSSSNNVIAGLATANDSVLVTSGTGVPSLSTTLPGKLQATPPFSIGAGTTKLSTLTVQPPADVTNIGGTTTVNASTTVTGSGTTFTTSLGVGDRISVSSAASTYATVTAIASDTSLTVSAVLGDGTSQTINKKSSIWRLNDASGAVVAVVDDRGFHGIGTERPQASLEVAGGSLSGDAILLMLNRTTAAKSVISFKTTHPSDFWVGASILVAGAFEIYDHAAAADRLLIDNAGNVGVATASFGTSAAGVLALGAATAGTTFPADQSEVGTRDWNGASTNAPYFQIEEGTRHTFGSRWGISLATTQTPTYDLSFNGQAAKTLGMERHTTSNTAGNNITASAGGATSGATDKAGGKYITSPGVNTGTGRSWAEQNCYTTAVSTGTGDGTSFTCGADGVYLALTDGSATNVVNLTLANDTASAIIIWYAVEVKDATDMQIEDGFVVCRAYNDAGAVAGNTCTETSTQTLEAGTLATTWAISAANPAVVSLNADTSLTPSTGYPRLRWSAKILGHQAMAAQ